MAKSIREWHDLCYEAFGALLTASSTNRQYSEQLPNDVLVDLSGRFNVWAGNIGAGQQRRASLDYRLREADYIQQAVIRTLRYLTRSIQKAHAIISGLRLPYDEVSSDSESSDTSGSHATDHDTRSTSATDRGFDQTLSTSELQQLQQSISSFINNLYQISIIIRENPAPHDRLIKSAKIETSFYEHWDIRHVQARFPQAGQNLWERLGKANSRRRKYFKYREQHREKLSAPHNKVSKYATGIWNAPISENGPEMPVAHIQRGQLTDGENPSARQPTVTKDSTTASTFIPRPVPAPLSLDAVDHYSDAATQSTSGSISSVAQDHLSIPNPPRSVGDATEFECPYCYTIFHYRSRDPWKRKKEWKQHVLRDVQPYVCTFGGCSQANTLYERRSDWMYHEIQRHRKEWSCNATGHEVYKSIDNFKAHMTKKHSGSFNTDQLDQIIDLLERPATFSRYPCPLCRDERFVDLDLVQLERHLGRHLQILATFALPHIGSENRASDDSVAAQDSTRSHEETSQNASTTDDSIPAADDSPSDLPQASETLLSEEDLYSGRQDAYPRELVDWLCEVEDPQIDLAEGHHWLSILAGQAPLRTPEMSLSDMFDEIKLCREQLDAEPAEYDTKVHISKLFEVALRSAERMLQRKKGLSKVDLQYQSLRRDHFKRLIQVILSNLSGIVTPSYPRVHVMRQDEFMKNSLEKLQAQLSLPLPWHAPIDTDQDWSFLDLGKSHPQEPLRVDEQQQDASVEGLCKWLAGVDQSQLLERYASHVCPGTVSWLTQSDEYKKFRNGMLRMLLIDGLPGCGKTVMCSDIIHHLQQESRSDRTDGVVYYFISASLKDADVLYRTLLCQLIRQLKKVLPKAQLTFRERRQSSKSLTSSQLESMLEEMAAAFDSIVFVIDGLDIIHQDTVQALFRFIRKTSNQDISTSNQDISIQLLGTSRASLVVNDALWDRDYGADFAERNRWRNSVDTFSIKRQTTNVDIAVFTRSFIEGDRVLGDLGLSIKKDIGHQIVRQSDGIFLFAQVQLRRVRHCLSHHDISQTLRTRPAAVDTLWLRILRRTMEKPGAKNAEAVRQILETLVVCERPLSKQEIHENLRCDSRGFNDKLDVWRMVPALLQLAGESSSFMDLCLVHGSLKEFLQSKELEGSLLGSLAVDEATAQRNITRRCVVDLLKYQQPSSYTSKFGWTAYAGRYWHKHAKKMARGRPYSHEAAIWRDCTRLLRPNTASFAHWTYMTGTDGGVDRDEQGDLGKKEGYPSPLYYAALLGLLPCAEDLIYQGESVNVSGGKHRSPLLAAVATGEIDLVKLLLEKGADPECRYANGDTALIRAVKIGRKEVFNLLLQAGVDLDASNDKRRMTAAHWAVQYDRPVLLESLLIAGAGADILDDLGRTLLHWAVQHDNITNTKLLSCTTNNLAVRDSQGLTPLHVAAGGSEQALEVLLEQKTAVKVLDAMTDDGKNALCIAAEGVNVGIVQKLIKKRASPMMLGPKCHTTSLHFAAAPLPDMENAPCGLSLDEVYEAKRQIVKLLLTHGADPWWRDSEWKRPEDVTEDPVIKKILQHSRGRLDSIESASRSE